MTEEGDINWKNSSQYGHQVPDHDKGLSLSDVLGDAFSIAVKKSVNRRFDTIKAKNLKAGCSVCLRTGRVWIVERISENGMLKLLGGSMPCNPLDCELVT